MQNSTICAISTAQGGAIGIVRVSGPDAIVFVNQIFSGRHSLLDAKGYTVHYGQIIDRHVIDNSVVDDVLVTVFRAPSSYTGEDSVEISCHGSSYILQRVIELLILEGCVQAAPGEFTQRAFANGKMDLSQAEAVADLIASQTASQHRVALKQLRGGISKKLALLREKLLHLTSLLELELDFSDHEDLEFADRSELKNLAFQIRDEISILANSFKSGNALKNGIPVAIIGAPNVGKSTLLNLLLDDDRAIVSDIQGTTRDVIEDTINIQGNLFRFIDTAGIRNTTDKIEQFGIERSIKAAERADIIILMRDNESDYPTLSLRNDQHVIRINNKSEEFQAINGKGLDNLISQLLELTPTHDTSELLIANLRHKTALDAALLDITRSIDDLNQDIPSDLISEDLRLCIHHLAEITGGEISSTEVLTNIFSHFCIGK